MKKLRFDSCGKSIKPVVIDICLHKAAVVSRNIPTRRCVRLNFLGRHTLREIIRSRPIVSLTVFMLGNFACIFLFLDNIGKK